MFKIQLGAPNRIIFKDKIPLADGTLEKVKKSTKVYGNSGFDKFVIALLRAMSRIFPSLKPMRVTMLSSGSTKLVATIGGIRKLLFAQIKNDYVKDSEPFTKKDINLALDHYLRTASEYNLQVNLDRVIQQSRDTVRVSSRQILSEFIIEVAQKKVEMDKANAAKVDAARADAARDPREENAAAAPDVPSGGQLRKSAALRAPEAAAVEEFPHLALYISREGKCVFCPANSPEARLMVRFKRRADGEDDFEINFLGDKNKLNIFEARILRLLHEDGKLKKKLHEEPGSLVERFLTSSNESIEDEYKSVIGNKMPLDPVQNTAVVLDNQTTAVNRIEMNGVKYLASGMFFNNEAATFWDIMLQEKPAVIVKLAANQPSDFDLLYWPNDLQNDAVWSTSQDDAGLSVTLSAVSYEPAEKLIKREFLIKKGEQTHTVVQLDYLGWPDGGVPLKEDLLNLLKRTNEEKSKQPGPIYVHCAAGIGRTGTFIAAHNALQGAEKGLSPNYYKAIMDLRRQRPYPMVETAEQYLFLHNLYRPELEFAPAKRVAKAESVRGVPDYSYESGELASVLAAARNKLKAPVSRAKKADVAAADQAKSAAAAEPEQPPPPPPEVPNVPEEPQGGDVPAPDAPLDAEKKQ